MAGKRRSDGKKTFGPPKQSPGRPVEGGGRDRSVADELAAAEDELMSAKEAPAAAAEDERSAGSSVAGGAPPPSEEDVPEPARTVAAEPLDIPAAGAGAPASTVPAADPGVTEAGAADVPKERSGVRRFSAVEWIGIAGVAAILMAGVIILLNFGPEGETGRSGLRPDRTLDLPVEGELVELTAADTWWRERTDADRGDPLQRLLPALRIQAEPASGAGSGPIFFRIHFRDSDGRIAGDVRTAKIEGGKFVDTGRGETVLPDGALQVAGSRGFTARHEFRAYRFGIEPRWSVEILTSQKYDAPESGWNRLAHFELNSEIR